MKSSTLTLLPQAGLSELVRALAPAQVRVSYAAHEALPFRLELPSNDGVRCYYGATLEAAAEAALRDRRSALTRFALEPIGDSAYAEALREWIERVTPANDTARPNLRLVR